MCDLVKTLWGYGWGGVGRGRESRRLYPWPLLSESGFPWEGDRVHTFYFPCTAAR